MRVNVQPQLLFWARERAGLEVEDLIYRFPSYHRWESGKVKPTFKQLESFAKTVQVPFGYLFLPEPPDERCPLPDFRTKAGELDRRLSPNLLDAMYLSLGRQGWYYEHAIAEEHDPLSFVGSAALTSETEKIAAIMRADLEFELEDRRSLPSWTSTLHYLTGRADELGVLVMVSAVVGNNTRRTLDPSEFSGFASSDKLAPLVFVNGAAPSAIQVFSLAHGLTHIWLGRSALSLSEPHNLPSHDVEAWCNRVAAELLVPSEHLQAELQNEEELRVALPSLVRKFKVSPLVMLRRLRDVGWLTTAGFQDACNAELLRLKAKSRGNRGSNAARTQFARTSKRFTMALVRSTLEGSTTFKSAFQLLDVHDSVAFGRIADAVSSVRPASAAGPNSRTSLGS